MTMQASECAIVIERLGDNHYRASCPLFPDCQAVAATAAAARRAVAKAIGRILRAREERFVPRSHGQTGHEEMA
jgi:predicted RNase H-like HicB family nuclease